MNLEISAAPPIAPAIAIDLLRHLTTLDVRYVLLHGSDRLEECGSHDLDVAVHPADVPRCIDAVREWNGFALVQVLHYEATGIGLVLARCEGAWEAITLDVTTDYRCSGRVFLTGPELLAGRVLADGVWRAAPDVELAFLLLKKFVEKGAIPAHQRARIAALTQMLGGKGAAVYRSLLGVRAGDALHRAIVSGQWPLVIDRTRDVARTMRRRAAAKAPARVVRYWGAELARRVGRLLHPTGVLVALLGPDGAGKSTIAAELCDTTSGPFRRTRRFHFRPGLLAGSAAGRGPTAARPPRGTAASIAKLFLYLADVWAGYLFVIRPALSRSTLVVFDRYFHDLLVDERRYAYGGPKCLLAWASVFVPAPDLFLFVVADPRSIQERKGELTAREAEVRVASYLELARAANGRVIHADSGVAAAVSEAQEALIAAMSRRAVKSADRHRHVPVRGIAHNAESRV
jgi:thymidylate kinase